MDREFWIRGKRVGLRPIRMEDAQDIYEYASVPGLGEMAGWEVHSSLENTKEIIEKVFLPAEFEFGIILNETGKLIGTIGYTRKNSMIGYALSDKYWGNGYAGEAVALLTDYVFGVLADPAVYCEHFVDNLKSRRVIKKLGFVESSETKFTNYRGEVIDCIRYIIRREWWMRGAGRIIDLRSDTVTHPTEKMRYAMSAAAVGDDVFEDDYMTKQLEKMTAEIMGKEAGLFVPSGTFGNQLAIMTHTTRGDEVLVLEDSHVIRYEVGAASVLSSVTVREIAASPKGSASFDIDALSGKIRQDDIHSPRTGLVIMENAHSSGSVQPLENAEMVKELTKSKGIPIHIDGARIFNAAAALGVAAREIAQYADTVNICLSKGLAAPVGSVLTGSAEFIKRARKNRKLMGGAMRQTGILAAAGMVAIRDNSGMLHVDNANARSLALGLSKIRGFDVKKDRQDINMVFFTVDPEVVDIQLLNRRLEESGIIAAINKTGESRMVTHYMVTDDDVKRVIAAVKSAC